MGLRETALAAGKGRAKEDFLEVYDRWVTPIYKYFISHVGDTALAEDLTSQLFLKAWQAYPRFEGRASVSSWLFRIAHNLAMDHFRAAARDQKYLRQQINAQQSSAAASRHEDLAAVQALLAKLDFQDGEALRLRYLNAMSYAEIGSVLGKSEGAAKKQVYRLLKMLQAQLGGDHD
jgi:RNA polymerase sigma-70 factor (ECF subfamily)